MLNRGYVSIFSGNVLVKCVMANETGGKFEGCQLKQQYALTDKPPRRDLPPQSQGALASLPLCFPSM